MMVVSVYLYWPTLLILYLQLYASRDTRKERMVWRMATVQYGRGAGVGLLRWAEMHIKLCKAVS